MTIHGINAPTGQSLLVGENLDTTGAAPEERILVPRPPQTGRSAEVEGASVESRIGVPHPPNMGWEHGGGGLTTYAVGGSASTDPSGYALLTAGGDPAKDVPGLPDAALEGLSAGGVPSLGATTLALIEQVSDDMRRANAEMRKEATLATVEELLGQAEKTRDQAALNLALGLTGAAISAGVSLGTSLRSGALLKSAGGIGANLSANETALLQTQNAVIEAQGKALHGAADAVDAVKNFLSASSDAALKESDARIETLRAHREALESLDESVKEVIKKALDAQQAISESMNETRKHILG